MKKVLVEVFPLLTEGLGNSKTEHFVIEERLGNDALFSDLVSQLTANHPILKQAILDPRSQRLRQEIIVFINKEAADLSNMVDFSLDNGDRVVFLMALPGG